MKENSNTESATKDKLNVEVGYRIRSIRESLNMSRDCFSELCNISESFLSDVERGNKGITSKTIIKICEKTNVSADYLLFGNTQQDSNVSVLLELFSKLDNRYVFHATNMLKEYLQAVIELNEKNSDQ